MKSDAKKIIQGLNSFEKVQAIAILMGFDKIVIGQSEPGTMHLCLQKGGNIQRDVILGYAEKLGWTLMGTSGEVSFLQK